ncbi:hypothetical protein Mame01_06560 [Microbispora amethystogenes]|nr:hypothetical protein Mame01_06560 [Microbispora amethystogenes]
MDDRKDGGQMGTDIRRLIAAERRELADLLSGLPPRAWDAPSLCAGWRVREVVAHLTLPYRHSGPRVLAGLVAARGNFDRLADRLARRDTASLTAEELTACLRDNAEHPWRPPGGGFEGALSHDVIHGMDITVALGVDRRVPGERLRVLLDGALSPRARRYFGVDLDGIELRADDVDWSFGSGVPLTGAAQDLVLVLSGRRLPEGRLRGEPSARFTRRAV